MSEVTETILLFLYLLNQRKGEGRYNFRNISMNLKSYTINNNKRGD